MQNSAVQHAFNNHLALAMLAKWAMYTQPSSEDCPSPHHCKAGVQFTAGSGFFAPCQEDCEGTSGARGDLD